MGAKIQIKNELVHNFGGFFSASTISRFRAHQSRRQHAGCQRLSGEIELYGHRVDIDGDIPDGRVVDR